MEMTFHAQALVRTDRPSRYAAQLAKHLGHKVETEWSAEAGYVKLTDGVCDMHAWPEGLRLDAYADTYDGLAHVEDVVKRHLERWGEGDTLKVEWQLRTPLPT
jgi:hypothetical protein